MNRNLLVLLCVGVLGAAIPCIAGQNTESSLHHEIVGAKRQARTGDLSGACQSLETTLTRARASSLFVAERKTLIWLAILRWDLGDIERSRCHFEEARAAFRQSNDKCSASFCSLCLQIVGLYVNGKVHRARGEYERSENSLRRAVSLGRETGYSGFELKCLRQLGMNSWDTKRWDDFKERNLAALAIARAMGHLIEEGRCLNNIGAFYQRAGLFAQASDHFEKALEKARRGSDEGTEAECLSNLGLLSRDLGDHGKALLYLSAAHDIDTKLGDLSAMAINVGNMAAVLLRKGVDAGDTHDLAKALELYRMNLGSGQLDAYQRFVSLNNMGIVLNEQGKTADARACFIQASAVLGEAGFPQERGAALNNIATTYLYEGRYDEALRNYRAAQEASRDDPLSEPLMESYLGMGQCFEGLRDLHEALASYGRAMEILDRRVSRISSEIFMIGYARNKFGAYQKVLRILSDQYLEQPSEQLIAEIFKIIERAKAKAFFENLGERRGVRQVGGPAADIGLARAALADERSLILEYYLAEDRSYLVSVSSNSLHLAILPNRHELARSLRGFLKMLPDRAQPRRHAFGAIERITNTLIPQPLAREMSGFDRLVVMPDGILNYLPFEALGIGTGKLAGFLIESMSVSYSPSVSVLSMLRRRMSAATEAAVLAIGGIRYELERKRVRTGPAGDISEDFQDIPYSRSEVNRIRRSFPADRVRTLTGGEVNERAVKGLRLKGYGIIHFACHGYVDEIDPLGTALVLTAGPSAGEDGYLRTEEIAGLETDADLVVLSSCRSASGLLENGEGILSVARPFFFAGARSVLATLWPIYDRSTAEFMGEFYRHLAKGQEQSEALRNAKITMIRSSRTHPFFWAGYVLSGAADR